jgi:hypothetical protein
MPFGCAIPRDTLAGIRTSTAKADLHTQPGATSLRTVAAEALRRVTSQKAAAIDMQINEGHLSRQLNDGSITLARLEVLGDEFAAEFGALLLEQFGDARVHPLDRAAGLLAEVSRVLMEARR